MRPFLSLLPTLFACATTTASSGEPASPSAADAPAVTIALLPGPGFEGRTATLAPSDHAELVACYRRRLTSRPELRGRVIADFGVDHDGTPATPIDVAGERGPNALDDADLNACIAKVLQRFALRPSPASALRVALVLDFQPRPVERAAPGTYDLGDGATLEMPVPTLTGGELQPSIIARYLRRNMNRFAVCYQALLSPSLAIVGTSTIDLTIDLDGKVSGVVVRGFETSTDACLASQMRTISFPRPHGVNPVTAVARLAFSHPNALVVSHHAP